ncbi:MAG TPA: tetratricopeptide repeat protein [Blastocatellia bacterium]|nr:tetratricopeptide repeat protein [Blastocatellia bacterium]
MRIGEGIYYSARGQYGEAEPLLSKAKMVYEKEPGEDHPGVATSPNNLAMLYHTHGRCYEN